MRAVCCYLGMVSRALLVVSWATAPAEASDLAKALHLAANVRGDYANAASVRFNLADVSTLATLNALPSGMKGVFWLGNGYNSTCSWRLSDEQITHLVNTVKNHSKFSGIYYISDEPHPAICPDAPEQLARRSALIRSLDPKGKTFIVVLNSSSEKTEFVQLKNSADYIGIDPYPCNKNNAETECNYESLRQRIDEALASGIPVDRIVPVFQTFGQACTTSASKYYRLPSIQETKAMLAIWDEKVPVESRPFDMAYSWGEQPSNACPTLQKADGNAHPDLRGVYAEYFAEIDRRIEDR